MCVIKARDGEGSDRAQSHGKETPLLLRLHNRGRLKH